ncbi:MAG: hypothetical protein ACI87E_001866 [Mariniblastus sp.]|jgi:hypothetical protein
MDGNRRDITESLSPLKAYSPTSKLDVIPLTRKTAKIESAVAPAPTVQSRRRGDVVRPSGSPVGAPRRATQRGGKLEESRSAQSTSIEESGLTESVQPSWKDALGGMSSLLVSTILHLILFLILAVFTFASEDESRNVVLEITDSPEQFEMMTTDIVLEDVEMEDADDLELSELELMEYETPDIPLGMLESVSPAFEEEDDLAMLEGLTGASGAGFDGDGMGGKRGPKANFFGVKSYGTKFVFVIDCSGSMTGPRWNRAAKELNQAVDKLEDGQEFLVLLYNSQTQVMLNANLRSAVLLPASNGNKRQFRYWLDRQVTNGGTYPAKAMYVALELKPDAIFLLSDGELQDATVSLLKEWNAESPDGDNYEPRSVIPINTISLGGQGQGQRVMRAIASQNNGVFEWAR